MTYRQPILVLRFELISILCMVSGLIRSQYRCTRDKFDYYDKIRVFVVNNTYVKCYFSLKTVYKNNFS
jgi:hypothetical protein